MGKRKSSPRRPRTKETAQGSDDAGRRERILKVRLTQAELRRIRFAAVLLDESHAQFLRNAALEKAQRIAQDTALLKQFRQEE
jgi:hypothetical protein